MKIPTPALLWLSACANGFAHADDAAFATELAILDDVPVVLSAARLVQPLRDAPGAVTVIDREMIRASGARDLAELLHWVPGFQVGRKTGATALTTYHGLSDDAPRRMLVRVDGRSAYAPYFVSGIEWATISVDIDDVERVEVFRGSNAAAYGSNAFLGIVNIVTRPAADAPAARVRLTQGANGLAERVVSVSRRFGNATARLTAGRQSEHGLDPVDDDYRNQRVDARIDWQLSADHQLEVHLGAVDSLARTGRAGSQTDPVRDVDNHTGFGQIRWRHQLGFGDEIKLTYFHQEERFSDPGFTLPSLSDYLINTLGMNAGVVAATFAFYGLPANAYVTANNDTRAIRDDIEFEHLLHPSRDTRLVWGAGFRSDQVLSQQVFNTNDGLSLEQARVFANFEWRTSAEWTINTGAMLEDTSASGPRVSPRLAANYHFTPQTTGRVAISRGYRTLTPYERYADIRYREANTDFVLQQRFQPTAGLSPERVTTRELGLRHAWLGGRGSVDLRVYDERIHDMVQRITVASNVTPTPPLNANGETPTYIGDGYANIRGVELSTSHRPTHDTWVGGHYAYTDINSNDRFADATAPRHAFTLFAAAALPGGWHVSASHGLVGSMQWYRTNAERVGAYHHTAVRLSQRFAVAGVDTEIAFGIDRISGSVADFLPTLTRPTQGYATIRMAF
ncbi:MAG: TonB-dependent receptor [Rhodocyclaceae bacterium]|nr:TonB-dependent receptor [Rhodocyclaceae bacterium]MCB1964266.1 TonB-dependent receptor [Rhodocyclaceae bacterium]